MLNIVVLGASAAGLILFVAFIATRLVRARSAGLSIRMQVFLALAAIVGAFAFGLGLMVLDRVKARADLIGAQAARSEARAIAALVGAEMEERGDGLVEVAARLEKRAEHPRSRELDLTLFDRDDRPVLESGRRPDTPGVVAVTVPIFVDGAAVGRARVVKPTLLIQQALADFAPAVFFISLLLGAVAASAAALIGRTIAQPIEALTAYAERVSDGDHRAPAPVGHGREVARLRRAIDSMRRELQGRPFVETFAADLSHELKNPVAAIRASAEVLEDGALDEPAEGRRFVARIIESTQRIQKLLDDLLGLARLEARGVADAMAVDFGRRAREAAEEARAAGAEVTVEARGPLTVRGDPTWLVRALANLIDNARVHGTPDTTIEVVVRREGDEVWCEITSRGEIQPGVRRRLFRRFVTTRATRGGTGLGLAIVRAVAEAHGGRVTCERTGPPLVSFRVALPAA
ncbi:MAG: histidine kinase dimerization/phospho-acceptor domain-containing protein [Myxococcota bacterium]